MQKKTIEITDAQVVQGVLQEWYKQSLYLTARDLCGYKDINERTHGDCIRALESSSDRKLIVMPRGTFKTSLAVVAYPIWRILRDPNIRILLDSEVWTLSKNSLREIKAHIKNERFQTVFPGLHLSLDNQVEITVSNRTKPKKEPTITGSGIGAAKTGQHFDLIIADDLNSERNSVTPEMAQQVIDHYRMYTSLLDPGGTLVVIGTRYSELDLIEHILKTELKPVEEDNVIRLD